MRRVLVLAVALAGVLSIVSADAAVTLPYTKTVALNVSQAGYYDPEINAGGIANRCVSSGLSDCLPHESDVAVRRTTYRTGIPARCLYTTDANTAQTESNTPTSSSPGQSGQLAFIFDFGPDANINGKYFKLKNVSAPGASGPADFDIFFTEKIGNCSQPAEGATQHPFDSIFSSPGDEQGRVPGYVGMTQGQTLCKLSATGVPLPGCPRYAQVSMFTGDPGSQFKLVICKDPVNTALSCGGN